VRECSPGHCWGRFDEELLKHQGYEFIPIKSAATKRFHEQVRKITCKLASILVNILTQTRNQPHLAIASRLH
jgi:hypothetical protein